MLRTLCVGAIAIAGMTAPPGYAASVSSSSAFASLGLAVWDGNPEDVVIGTSDPESGESASAIGGGVSGAGSLAFIDPVAPYLGEVGVFAEANAPFLGAALGDAFASVEWTIENVGSSAVTFLFELDWSIFVETAVDLVPEDFGFAYAEVVLSLAAPGDLFNAPAFVEDTDPPLDGSDVFLGLFTIDAGDSSALNLDVVAVAYSETLTSVPLPVSGVLMIATLGGLASLRLRRH